MTAGTAWISVPGQAATQLMPGDVVLLPRGAAHALASDQAALARTGERVSSAYERTGPGSTRIGDPPTRTTILCAHFAHDPVVATQVLTTLPDLVHLRGHDGDGGLQDTTRLLTREFADPQIATTVVLDRLVDVLLVQLLRAWAAHVPPSGEPCWLHVLGDPVVGAALTKLHGDPARPWTTAALADEVAVSRATLARRFATLIGESPAAYLTRWRMDLAARRLRDTDDPVEVVAEDVGYTSVHAFSRAFSRTRGRAPGRFRVSARVARTDDRPVAREAPVA